MDQPNCCTNVNCPNFIHVLALLTYLMTSKEYQKKLEKYVNKLEKLNAMIDLQFAELEQQVKKL